MDFLEDLFGFGDRQRDGKGPFNRDAGHHDEDGRHLGAQDCPRCHNRAIPGARFCNGCGQALPLNSRIHCLDCGLIQQPGAKFCPGCGVAL